jgi:hypothetical protein
MKIPSSDAKTAEKAVIGPGSVPMKPNELHAFCAGKTLTTPSLALRKYVLSAIRLGISP